MTEKEIDDIKRLLAYIDAWRAAHKAWLAWIESDWLARLAFFKELRRAGHRALINAAVSHLEVDKGRVKAHTQEARRKINKFRTATDAAFAGVVLQGHAVFGIQGKRDEAGIFHGNMMQKRRELVFHKFKTILMQLSKDLKNAER